MSELLHGAHIRKGGDQTDNGSEYPECRGVHAGLGEYQGSDFMALLGCMNILHQDILNELLVIAVDNHPHAAAEKIILNLFHFGFKRQQAFAAGDRRPFHEHGNDLLLTDHSLPADEDDLEQLRYLLDFRHRECHKYGGSRTHKNDGKGGVVLKRDERRPFEEHPQDNSYKTKNQTDN
ncbi:hypothetical protein D3C71_1498450 [compost metagenome]